jgi:DUF4097 and DUF4098 domain-containing protein YvlB
LALWIVACLLPIAAARAEDCKIAADRTASSPLAGIERVEIETEAGDLHVTGMAGATIATARGKACASGDDMMEGITLEMERADRVLRITAKTPAGSVLRMFGKSSYARLDLEITIPPNLPVTLVDTSGDLEVAGVAALDLKDDAGDILVHDIARDVAIDDSSGDLTVANVKGNVTLKDGSGDIKVSNVGGTVEVTSDGSGDIDVQEVARGLVVRSDSSGEINFSRVRGNIEIPARRQ